MMLVEVLKSEMNRRSEKDRKFSLRSFAKLLGISPATLSQILNGHRPITTPVAARILKNIDIAPAIKNDLLQSHMLGAINVTNKVTLELSAGELLRQLENILFVAKQNGNYAVTNKFEQFLQNIKSTISLDRSSKSKLHLSIEVYEK